MAGSGVVKRTLVGSTLAAATIGVLLLARGELGGWISIAVGTLLAVGCIVEAARTGMVRGAAWTAVPALVVVTASLVLAETERTGAGPAGGAGARELGLAAVAATLGALAGRTGPGRLFQRVCLGLWLALPLPWLYHVWVRGGAEGLAALLILSKVGDTAGYYVGRSIGRTRPFPGISPNKTTAGCVASLVAGTLAGVACAAAGWLPTDAGSPGADLARGAIAGAVLNVAAQAGDLFESLLKRRAGVKDSGALFGPSGGTLDVVDSLLVTIPVALALWPAIFSGSAPSLR